MFPAYIGEPKWRACYSCSFLRATRGSNLKINYTVPIKLK
jgi:hypothetical protein